jgi:phosphopantetheinyl transferase
VPGSDICFNLSHSSELFACIVSRKREVGIVCPISGVAEIASRYFARAEVDW